MTLIQKLLADTISIKEIISMKKKETKEDEMLREVMDEYKKRHRVGGKKIGLSFMVLFGAPIFFITLALLWQGVKWVFSIP